MADVIHNVPVVSPGGDTLGTAIVAEGHIEIVFDRMNIPGYIFEPLKLMMADAIIIQPRNVPAHQGE
jgi:hypothetical protein